MIRYASIIFIFLFSSFSYSGYNSTNFVDKPGDERCMEMTAQRVKVCFYYAYLHSFNATMNASTIRSLIGNDVSYVKIYPLQVNTSELRIYVALLISDDQGFNDKAMVGFDNDNSGFNHRVETLSMSSNLTIPANTPLNKPYIIPFANNQESAGAKASFGIKNLEAGGSYYGLDIKLSSRVRDTCTINIDSAISGTIYFGDTFPTHSAVSSQTGKKPSKFTVEYSGSKNKTLTFSDVWFTDKPINFTRSSSFKLYLQDADKSAVSPVTEVTAPIVLNSLFDVTSKKRYNAYLYSTPSLDKAGNYKARATITCSSG